MRVIVTVKLLFCIINLSVAINGTKRKRKSLGLTFQKLANSRSLCQQLSCKDGMGYTGSDSGECFMVSRCKKCRKTSFEESNSFCSTIPNIQGEIAIFSGSLKLTTRGIETLKSNKFTNDSETSEDDNFQTGESGSSQEDEEDEDDDADEENSSEYHVARSNVASSSVGYSGKFGTTGHSLLELVSQMTESEFEEDHKTINNKEKSNKPRSKGLLNVLFGKRKKKNIDSEDQAATFRKSSGLSFSLKNLKSRLLNNGLNKASSDSDGTKKNKMSLETETITTRISKGTILEWEAKGHLLTERLNKCTDVGGLVPITIHTFLQHFNVKKLSKVKLKRFKYAAFEFTVNSSCSFDELCSKPSIFVGRLTPGQKLVMSNSISVPVGLFKKSGISELLNSIKAKYICKSPRCLPEQYNSCVKITCAINKSYLQDQEWRKIQVCCSKENEVHRPFCRKFVAEEQNSISNEKNIGAISNKMNGNLSFIDYSDNLPQKNDAYQIDDSEDSVDEQIHQNEELGSSESTESSIIAETHKEEGVVDAPPDGVRSSALIERLKRSLGAPAEGESDRDDSNSHSQNNVHSNTNVGHSEDILHADEEEVPLQPEITIITKNKESNGNLKSVIYATLGIACTAILIIGVMCVT
ncbi:putative signal peptide-containing protein and acidic stretch [Cryptosporidium canis]|uniref:Signal peptide-containing protein and acidic stretch n=1 Tax=Cryptosporidium canis TaxID=195482 RepID=A0ABQ8P6V7_9CRYT|nr:putative signal peptide-containing protein and acidic stretch [Cryptosporidium canis]KAJ1610880.1 putative signal peptide-containing protein and acidic stretch [Cryptosporidium canis]